MNREEVLELYRKGDENKRLSLFLGYRDLRDDFSLIEQESEHDDFVISWFPWSRKYSNSIISFLATHNEVLQQAGDRELLLDLISCYMSGR